MLVCIRVGSVACCGVLVRSLLNTNHAQKKMLRNEIDYFIFPRRNPQLYFNLNHQFNWHNFRIIIRTRKAGYIICRILSILTGNIIRIYLGISINNNIINLLQFIRINKYL